MKRHLLLFLQFSITVFGLAGNAERNLALPDNSGYDVHKYKLEYYANPELLSFSGKTTVYFNVLKSANQIEFDAGDNLTIKEVVYKGQSVTDYVHTNKKIRINLPTALTLNATDSISVSFSGQAGQSAGYVVRSYFDNQQKERFVSYTFSEYFDAPATWWVCKDGLTDKADEIDFIITHPSSYKAVANGALISTTNNRNGTTTTVWSHQYPIPTYAIGLAVAEYEEYHQKVKIGNTQMPVLNYLYPESKQINSGFILKLLDKVPSYITYFSELFGEYPFKNEKYGHAEWLILGGMEHSTVSFIGHYAWSDMIIIHELAHQWFGDQYTCATWNDIWLNEGFATYAELLMYEHEAKKDPTMQYKYDNWFIANTTRILNDGREGSVFNPYPDDYNRTFSSVLSYRKGGMVLHQLRTVLGDDVFFHAVRTFLDESQFNFVTTEDFKQSLKNSTGRDLTEFFNDWIYGEGYPVFDLTITGNAINNVYLKVDQTQTHPSVSFFETLFKVKFIGPGNESVIREFNLTHNHQTFHITDIPFEIKEVVFNPNLDIIAKENKITVKNEVIKSEESVKIIMNPVSNLLAVTSTDRIQGIRIYDQSGRLIESANINHTSFFMPTTNWHTGVYIVKVKSSKGDFSKKIRKE